MQDRRCFNCLNYKKDLKCIAFPNGIPKEILLGENNHSKPLENQANNIIFEEL